jgi:two-component system phosphate regulon sensor histidine kinase PhoR
MRFRTRLFLGILTVLLAGLAIVVVVAQNELRSELEARYQAELSRAASLTAATLADRELDDALADSLGRVSGLRVTFIGVDGTVVGDSDVPAELLPTVENHAGRPEIRAALRGELGVATRASETVSRELLYVAAPHPAGAVRLSLPLESVRRTVIRSRRFMLSAGAMALLTAAVLSLLLASYLPRPLRAIRETARAIAAGDLSRRVRPRGSDDIADLGHAIDDMAEQLERTVRDLRLEKSDLSALFESLEDGIAVVDEAGVVVRANPAFEHWAGRREVKETRFATLFRDPGIGAAAADAVRGIPSSHESRLADRTLLMSTRPYGRGAVVIMRDLTELRQLEGVRRDFVANVSHELKTPLTGILGFAEPLVEGDVPPDQAQLFAQRIEVNARRMRDLLNDLLDLARVESGSWDPQLKAVRLDESAVSTWARLAPIPDAREVRLEVDETARVAVDADPEALSHILHNLFENAIRFSPAGGTIVLRARVDGRMTRVEVQDQGPGIPRQHQARVFERFYRVDTARDRESGGTGLGLSIVKHLVVAHGGNVGVRSELGEGSTFWFTLPTASD